MVFRIVRFKFSLPNLRGEADGADSLERIVAEDPTDIRTVAHVVGRGSTAAGPSRARPETRRFTECVR